MPNDSDFKKQIEANLHSFLSGNLKQNALRFLKTLGYESDKKIDLQPNTAEGFKAFLKQNSEQLTNEKKAHLDEWETVDFLFQLTDEEISRTKSLFDTSKVDVSDKRIDSYLFFAIKLKKAEYRRSELAEITREINRTFPMPVMILFQHGDTLTFSIIDRRLHKRDTTKDVLQKVTLIKDIRLENPHRAHVEILEDLALQNYNVSNFVELHNAWQKTLDTKELNKRFFQELANWYFWAVDNAEFPADEEKDADIRNATNVIRLITRVMFVWFLKEKGLVSDKLFDEKELKKILRFKNDSAYYKAILQNLFFATLNSEMNTRKFIAENSGGRNAQHFVHNVFRYQREFIKPEETIKELFEPIPFLNGGLFECLDKETEVDGTKCRVRVDGFSDHPKNVLEIPDELFFGSERQIELNEIYGTKNKKYKVRGLINILNSYKFTITENTPIEEEIALDPELLGKVFENLLANFNPETKTTARKQTGSFYTPREIVNYMVDESLLAYLKAKLQTETQGFAGFVAFGENQPTMFGNEQRIQQKFEMPVSNNRWHGKDESLETALRNLFSYTEDKHQFNETEIEILIKAIDNCKILDPACGSGAFPMGILHRLVYLLGKLDKANAKWREWQEQKAKNDAGDAFKITDQAERDERLREISDVFENNANDYGRKLFLIENCIYGVDIQPIAIQIAKLRFFISLIVDQKASDDTKNNLGIRPLPNLETKFVAANTLIGLETNGGLKPNGVTELEKQLKEVRAKHFGARTRKTKEKHRTEDKKIRSQIAELLKQGGINETSADLITDWNPYDQNASAKWFDAEWMFGIEKGFDIVIGNPPYGVNLLSEIEKKYFRVMFSELQFKIDMYSLFVLIAKQLLKKNGICFYIIPSTFIDNFFEEKIRYKLIKETTLNKVIELDDNIFEAAVVHSMLLSFINRISSSDYIIDFSASKSIDTDFIKVPAKYVLEQPQISYSIRSFKYKILLNKLETNSIHLEKIVSIKDGIDTGDNKKYISDIKVDSKWKPLITGRDIDRYAIKTHRYVLYGSHLANPRRPQVFEQEKIVIRETGNRIIAAYDDDNHYALSTLYNINLIDKSFSLKYLLALLNSNLFHFLMCLIAFDKTKGAFTKTRIFHYYKLPIKNTESQQIEIAEIVDEIIETKKQEATANTSKFECKIDKLVYQLYGLTDEEILIVEGKDN